MFVEGERGEKYEGRTLKHSGAQGVLEMCMERLE